MLYKALKFRIQIKINSPQTIILLITVFTVILLAQFKLEKFGS